MKLFTSIENYIQSLSSMEIPEDRKVILDELVTYVGSVDQPKLNFICTHNSRRSHLSQIWAQTMGFYFGIEVKTYSGGTEATAFNPNAVAAIERSGFKVDHPGGDNPKYKVSFSDLAPEMENYSKVFDAPENPSSNFAAIMTCSEADSGCPVVFGASQRIKLFYEDPKIADGTPQESETYDERCRQIAAEMHYVFKKVSENN